MDRADAVQSAVSYLKSIDSWGRSAVELEFVQIIVSQRVS